MLNVWGAGNLSWRSLLVLVEPCSGSGTLSERLCRVDCWPRGFYVDGGIRSECYRVCDVVADRLLLWYIRLLLYGETYIVVWNLDGCLCCRLLYGEKISVKPGARTSCDHGSVFPSCCPANPDFLYQTLNVLKSMSEISLPPRKDGDSSHIGRPLPEDTKIILSLGFFPDPPPVNFVVDPLAFASQKITSKIMTQLGDVITLASSTLPVWCDIMMTKYPRIFAYDTRRLYFTATAFGSERYLPFLSSGLPR